MMDKQKVKDRTQACTDNPSTTFQVSRCGNVSFCSVTLWQKVGADSRFLRRDLVPLQENQAGLLMGQLAASVCVILIHRGPSDN